MCWSGFPSLLRWVQTPLTLQQNSLVSYTTARALRALCPVSAERCSERNQQYRPPKQPQLQRGEDVICCFSTSHLSHQTATQRFLSWKKLVVISWESSVRPARAEAGAHRAALPSHCSGEAVHGGDKAARNARASCKPTALPGISLPPTVPETPPLPSCSTRAAGPFLT